MSQQHEQQPPQDHNDEEEKDSLPLSRPLLIVNHNPKAGGGSIIEFVKSFKSHAMNVHRFEESVLQNVQKLNKNETEMNTTFLEVKEQFSTTWQHRKLGFVIGSVREPCSQYVSLWAYGSAGRGGFSHRYGNLLVPFYGQDEPYFNSTADVQRFQQWWHHPAVQGLIGERIHHSYGQDLDGADCYVLVERFQESFLYCLQMYHNQGGFVDWSNSNVTQLVDIAHAKQNAHRRLRDPPNNQTKDDALGNPQMGHHASCDTYFPSRGLRQEMEQGSDEAFVYDVFGYQGCCSKEMLPVDTRNYTFSFLPVGAAIDFRSIPAAAVGVLENATTTTLPRDSNATKTEIVMAGNALDLSSETFVITAATLLVLLVALLCKKGVVCARSNKT